MRIETSLTFWFIKPKAHTKASHWPSFYLNQVKKSDFVMPNRKIIISKPVFYNQVWFQFLVTLQLLVMCILLQLLNYNKQTNWLIILTISVSSKNKGATHTAKKHREHFSVGTSSSLGSIYRLFSSWTLGDGWASRWLLLNHLLSQGSAATPNIIQSSLKYKPSG